MHILLTRIPVQLQSKKGPIIPSSELISQLHGIKDIGLFYLIVILSSTPNFHLLVKDGCSSFYHQVSIHFQKGRTLLFLLRSQLRNCCMTTDLHPMGCILVKQPHLAAGKLRNIHIIFSWCPCTQIKLVVLQEERTDIPDTARSLCYKYATFSGKKF